MKYKPFEKPPFTEFISPFYIPIFIYITNPVNSQQSNVRRQWPRVKALKLQYSLQLHLRLLLSPFPFSTKIKINGISVSVTSIVWDSAFVIRKHK